MSKEHREQNQTLREDSVPKGGTSSQARSSGGSDHGSQVEVDFALQSKGNVGLVNSARAAVLSP